MPCWVTACWRRSATGGSERFGAGHGGYIGARLSACHAIRDNESVEMRPCTVRFGCHSRDRPLMSPSESRERPLVPELRPLRCRCCCSRPSARRCWRRRFRARRAGRPAGSWRSCPAALFAALARPLSPDVAAGRPVRLAIDWVPALDLRLAFLIDGLEPHLRADDLRHRHVHRPLFGELPRRSPASRALPRLHAAVHGRDAGAGAVRQPRRRCSCSGN